MHRFALLIDVWYRQNHRKLPWRDTKSAYKIWLSEIILQQTRVNQGLDYYLKIVKKYPTVQDLANAEEQEVLKMWQGLGYYSRARNMLTAAKQVRDEFDGKFPSTYKDLMQLKGVGDYTASAIASFAYNLPHPVVDGNVYRVLSRYFNDSTPIDTGAGAKVFKAYAKEVMNPNKPGDFNQAIMELGALVCKPKNPDCQSCPLNETCLAYREGDPLSLPVKSKKTKVSARYFNYLVHPSPTIQLKKRTGKGIWRNMFEFPVVETEKEVKRKVLQEKLNENFEGVTLNKKVSSVKHILSHQHLFVTFWEVKEQIKEKDLIAVDLVSLEDYPLPRPIERFVEEHAYLFSD